MSNERLARRELGLEPLENTGVKIGRDPRAMSTTDLQALGHKPMAVLDALRARCLDCCAGSADEVRKCVSVECPAWPFRMGWNPWRERRQLSDDERKQLGARLAATRKPKP
jgi:hypothetical protein